MRFALTLVVLLCIMGGIVGFSHGEECTLRIQGTKGAHVWIDGKGFGPLPLEEFRLPGGPHEIVVRKIGFETHREKLWLHSFRGESRVVYLPKKTRWNAAWRSFLFPGWGVHYNDRPLRGTLYMTFEACVLLYAAWENHRFQDRKDIYVI